MAARLPPTRLALLTDLDGVLSPIAVSPALALVDQACRAALTRLVTVLPLVACVSGRPAAEAARLVNVPGMRVSGSHGLEVMVGSAVVPSAEALRLRDHLALAEARLQVLGVGEALLERKPFGRALHYRQARDPEAARAALEQACAAAIAGLKLRVVPGRMVLEIVPDLADDKGSAVAALLREADPAAALYLGDDVTDLAAFAALEAWGQTTGRHALRLAVWSTEAPPAVIQQADYLVSGVAGVAAILTYLAERYLPAVDAAAPPNGRPPGA